jgi:hypothetical protein
VTSDVDSKRASPLKSPDGSTSSSNCSSSSGGGGKLQQPGISPGFNSRLLSSLPIPTAPILGEVETANRRSTDSSPRYASAAGSREIEDGGERRRREDAEDKDGDSCSRTVGHSSNSSSRRNGERGAKRKSSLSSPSQVPAGSQQSSTNHTSPGQSRDHSHHHHQRHSPLTSSSSDKRSSSDMNNHEKRDTAAGSISGTAASSDGDEVAMWRKWFPWLTATTSGVAVPQRVPAAVAAPSAMFSLPPTSSGSMPGPSSVTSSTSGGPGAPSSAATGGPFMHAPGERGGFCAPCPSSSPWVAHCTCYCAYFPHYPGTPSLAPRSPAGSTPSLPYPSPFGGYSLPSPASLSTMDGPGGPAYMQDAFRAAAAAAAAASSSSYPWSLAGAYAGLLPTLGLASPSPFDLLARASMGDSHRVPSPTSLSLPSPYTPSTYGLDAMFGKRLLAERPLDLSQRRF